MSSPKAAARAAAPKATSLAALLSPTRAEASRRNGAKSRGPKTPEGKARSAQNALKHGLCAQHLVAIGDEDLDAFDALEAALIAELAPQGMLQAVLVRRIVAASWRLERAERMEAELFAQNARDTTSFGLGMIRDCDGPRAFDTLLRYRGGTLAELWRSLRTLKALQAEAEAQAAEEVAAQQDAAAPGEDEADQDAVEHAQGAQPNEPETRASPGESQASAAASPAPDPATPLPGTAPARVAAHEHAPDRGNHAPGCRENPSPVSPNKPKGRAYAGEWRCQAGPVPGSPEPAAAASRLSAGAVGSTR